MSASPQRPATVRSSASRLASPRLFLAEWWEDLRRAPRLAWMLFRRSLNQQYRHSSMGILLAFTPALATAAVFAFGRRSHLLAGTTGGVNSAFFGVVGILMAQAFVEAFQAGRKLFSSHLGMLRRQPVPIEAPILAILLDLGFRDLIRLIVMAGLFFAFAMPPRVTAPLAVWGLLGITLVGFGTGLLAAAPSALRQDIGVLSAGLPLILITVTPVFGVLPDDTLLGRVQRLNPLSWLLDGIRAAAYGGSGSIAAAAAGPVAGLVLLALGWLVCRVARPHLAEKLPG